jgi:hypothetical protein
MSHRGEAADRPGQDHDGHGACFPATRTPRVQHEGLSGKVMIGNAVEALIDLLFEGTGRLLLGILGVRPSALAATFVGLGFWAALAITALWILRN